MAKKLIAILLALSFASPGLLLTGCNTVGGVGKDVKAAGSEISEEAREHKKYSRLAGAL